MARRGNPIQLEIDITGTAAKSPHQFRIREAGTNTLRTLANDEQLFITSLVAVLPTALSPVYVYDGLPAVGDGTEYLYRNTYIAILQGGNNFVSFDGPDKAAACVRGQVPWAFSANNINGRLVITGVGFIRTAPADSPFDVPDLRIPAP